MAELEETIATLPQRQQRATDLHAERTSHLGRLAEVRRRKFRLVHEAARQLNTALGPRVRLKVYALADRMGFQEALEDAVRGQNVRSEQIARLGRGSIARVLRRSMRPP